MSPELAVIMTVLGLYAAVAHLPSLEQPAATTATLVLNCRQFVTAPRP